MDIVTILGIIAGVSTSVERLAEVIKPLYLKAKSALLKKTFDECSGFEKEAITMLLGPILCISLSINIGISVINPIMAQIFVGLLASLGSNVIHAIMSIVVAIKDNTECVKNPNCK